MALRVCPGSGTDLTHTTTVKGGRDLHWNETFTFPVSDENIDSLFVVCRRAGQCMHRLLTYRTRSKRESLRKKVDPGKGKISRTPSPSPFGRVLAVLYPPPDPFPPKKS